MRRTRSKPPRSRSQPQPRGVASDSCASNPAPDPRDTAAIQESFLKQIAAGAKLCQEVEAQLRAHRAPNLETIIQLYRVLVLKLSAEVQDNPKTLALLNSLIKPVMDWERLEEKRKDRELEQQKYRDQQAARQSKQPDRDGALHPETLEKIERELKLF